MAGLFADACIMSTKRPSAWRRITSASSRVFNCVSHLAERQTVKWFDQKSHITS